MTRLPLTTPSPSSPHLSSSLHVPTTRRLSSPRKHSFHTQWTKVSSIIRICVVSAIHCNPYSPRDVIIQALLSVESVTGCCTMCLSTGTLGKVDHHTFYNCPTFLDTVKISRDSPKSKCKDYASFKKLIHYPIAGCKVCWRCHIPFLNDYLHPPPHSQPRRLSCDPQHDDLILPLAYILFFTQNSLLSKRFGYEWPSDEAYALWLIKTEKGKAYTNLFRVFMWLVRELSPYLYGQVPHDRFSCSSKPTPSLTHSSTTR